MIKKTIGSIFLTVMLAAQLSGCGAGEKEAPDAPDMSQGAESSGGPGMLQGTESSAVSGAAQGTESSAVSGTAQDAAGADSRKVSVDGGDVPDPFAVQALEGRDNSMDAYSASARVAMKPEMPENAVEGGGQKSILGATGAYYFKKHLFHSVAECWDEVLFVTAEGKAGSEHYGRNNQLWDIGPVAGTDHYATLGVESRESGEDRYFLTERDENHEYLREFPLDFLSGDISAVLTGFSDFMVDQSGTVSLVQGGKYLLVSQEGEVLGEYAPEGGSIRRLVALYDGRIAFETAAKGNNGGTLQCMDGESGKPVTLAAWEKTESNIYYVTLFDEDTLLYADKDGLYRSGLSGENPELIYRWSNHGILIHGISALQADEEGRIALIYSDSENDTYLCLEPTAEEVPICKITMNVRNFDVDGYQWLVAEFNKRYPSCHIELSGYDFDDKTALLTQLTAGKGPVLIDPSWLGFEELEELWEPLDTVMEQLGITEELYPNVMEMGKIDGTLYGMVRDFDLETVVADPDIKDWDYDMFFQCVQDRPELESICNYYAGESGHYYFLNLLNHGLEDNFFIITDEETGEMHFDSGRFRRFLELADQYCSSREGVQPGSSLLEGKTLCNRLSILKPGYVAAYRTIYGEDVSYIGYPTKDGGTHFMSPSCMLSIRKSATKEEKEAAVAFLALYLSYEGQTQAAKDINFRLSVRRDVLEEQIASMKAAIDHMPEFGPVSMGGNMDIERDRATLLDMIDKARPGRSLPRELMDILSEELDLYLADSITEDMLIDHLENRIGLYLGERN